MSNYDDYNDFHGIYGSEGDLESGFDDLFEDLDGDHESGLASAGFGTDEDYGFYDYDE